MSSIYEQLNEACRQFGKNAGEALKEFNYLITTSNKKGNGMNENIADEIRKTIESVKDMKIQVGGINNYLSILEGMMRADIQKKVDEAYQKGYDKGYADKTNNDEVCKNIAKDIQDEAYQKGLTDAWEAARKVVLDEGIDMNTLCTIFGRGCSDSIIRDYSASEAIAKLKAYEEKQKADDEIKVGDEVIYNEHRFIVFTTETEEHYASLFDVNGNHASASQSKCKKTGRHFNIGKILEEMKE